MRIAELIWSNKPSHRFVRHLVFWVIYCTYFWVQSLAPRTFSEFNNRDTYYFALLNLCCFGPVFVFAVYFSIYYLLPKTLAKKRYALFLFYFLLLYAAGMFVNYFMAGIFLRHVHYSTPVEVNFEHKMEFGSYNARWGMIIAVIAIGIKSAKNWVLQQKDNLEMLKKKNRTEMQLQKARLHPEFLLRTLGSVYDQIQAGSGKAPAIVLKLSELLSYSLYENDKDLVPLENELEQLNNFIALEQLGGVLEEQIQTPCNTKSKYLVPLIIIKLLEESMALLHVSGQEDDLTKLQVAEVAGQLSVVLYFHPSAINWSVAVENSKKRLLEYYSPNDFTIELAENRQQAIVSLRLMLRDGPKGPNADHNIHSMAVAYDNV